MTIHHHGEDQYGMFPATPAEVHARQALEQAARYAADLAIARWSGTPDTVTPARAAWMGRAHQHLQAWLDAGGFAQHEVVEPADTAATDTPLPYPGKRPLFYSLFRQPCCAADLRSAPQ